MKDIKTFSGGAALTAGAALALTALSPLTLLAETSPLKTDATVARLVSAKSQAGTASVIVHFYGPLTQAQETALKALKADITKRLPIIQSAALTLPARSLGALAALPFVTHVSSDGAVLKYDEFADASSGAMTARQQYRVDGSAVGVAILDSGFQYNYDVSTGYPAADFVPNDPAQSGGIPYDWCGHGTHVAGIVGGTGYLSGSPQYTHHFNGIAPNAGLVNVKVLDTYGQGQVSWVISGIQWVMNFNAAHCATPIRVLNLSLGHPVGESYKTDPLCQAVEAAWKSGIVVVCAAGNSGRINSTQSGTNNEGWGTAYGSIQSPANDPYVITVGAAKSVDGIRAHDKIATYSSRGPSRLDLVLKPDLVAPGNKIISCGDDGDFLEQTYPENNVPVGYYDPTNSNPTAPSTSYYQLSGTSMAAPVVAGAAALMLQKDPSLSPDTVKARLMIAADKWGQTAVAQNAGLKVQYLASGTSASDNQIRPTLRIVNTSTTTTALNTLTLRYWYSSEGTQAQSYWCDYAQVGAGNIRAAFGRPAAPTAGADAYVELSFTTGAGSLVPGGSSGDIQSRFAKSDWSAYTQTNDYSFDATRTSYADYSRVTLYKNGVLVWGTEPSSTAADPCTYGAGYLNITATLASTVIIPTGQYAISPKLYQDASGNVLVDTTQIGTSSIWGSKAVTGVGTIYGSKAVTGVNSVASSKAVCGSNVWANKAVCGSSGDAVDLSSVALHGE